MRRSLNTHVDVVAETLEREDSGLASDVSVGDVGLYAEHPLIHGWTRQRRGEEVADRGDPDLSDRSRPSQPKRGRD